MFDGDALTAEEVAEMLRVSKNSVYRLAQSGELASYRVGRKLRFTLRDVEAYTRADMRSQKGAQTSNDPSSHPRTAEASPSPSGAREGMSEMPRAFSLDGREPFVIAGNDLSGDIIAHALAAAGLPVSRAYVGSYTALVNLYAKQANAALVHLYDQRTNAYNVPSVQRIAPGMPVVVIRLLKRKQGFIVQAGNPKKLTTWGGLLREGVRLANRERGCGTRVLLDEKLLSPEARPEMVEGRPGMRNRARGGDARLEGLRRRGDRHRAFGEGAARPRLRSPANRMARHRRREEPAHCTACAGDPQDCGKRVLPRCNRCNRGLRGGEHRSHHLRELVAPRP